MGKYIIEELKKDFKESILEKDTIRKNLVQMLRSNIQNYIRDNKLAEADIKKEDIYEIINREMKQQKDSLEAFEKGNRKDLAEETKVKILILEGYLPKQMTEIEIKQVIQETLKDLQITKYTNKEKGLLMKSLMPKIKGKADGKLVNQIVEQFLGE